MFGPVSGIGGGLEPQWVYGEYVIQGVTSPFGRSDDFKITPRNFQIGSI